jgi:multicomponent Na+:H+ antiporter subunit E
MTTAGNELPRTTPFVMRSAFARWSGFLLVWLLLAAPDLAAPIIDNLVDLLIGVLAAAAAAWTSLRLLPPTPGSLRYGALFRLAARVLRNSVVSGFSLLPRVFGPRLSIAPGYLAYPVRLAPGPARAVLGALTSVVPGSLSVGTDRDGALVYHCLDVAQPVAEDLAIDEALLIETLCNKLDVRDAASSPDGDARA